MFNKRLSIKYLFFVSVLLVPSSFLIPLRAKGEVITTSDDASDLSYYNQVYYHRDPIASLEDHQKQIEAILAEAEGMKDCNNSTELQDMIKKLRASPKKVYIKLEGGTSLTAPIGPDRDAAEEGRPVDVSVLFDPKVYQHRARYHNEFGTGHGEELMREDYCREADLSLLSKSALIHELAHAHLLVEGVSDVFRPTKIQGKYGSFRRDEIYATKMQNLYLRNIPGACLRKKYSGTPMPDWAKEECKDKNGSSGGDGDPNDPNKPPSTPGCICGPDIWWNPFANICFSCTPSPGVDCSAHGQFQRLECPKP